MAFRCLVVGCHGYVTKYVGIGGLIGGWLTLEVDSSLHHSHPGCPILRDFRRVGGTDADIKIFQPKP